MFLEEEGVGLRCRKLGTSSHSPMLHHNKCRPHIPLGAEQPSGGQASLPAIWLIQYEDELGRVAVADYFMGNILQSGGQLKLLITSL